MAAPGRRLPLTIVLPSCGAVLAIAGVGMGACYSAGSGSAPPTSSFYFPVGLAVSNNGQALYVANSDFDLQFNGGTLQSYDLTRIREDTAVLIASNVGQQLPPAPATDAGSFDAGTIDADIPFFFSDGGSSCSDASIVAPAPWPSGQRPPLGMSCAPPVDSTNDRYRKQTADIGAFASDLQLSVDGTRLFTTVRGDATLTWATVEPSAPLAFNCGQLTNGGRCDATHQAGNNSSACGNTRHATMPGEPFSFAQTEDGTALAVTQQATQETSLLLSGISPRQAPSWSPANSCAAEVAGHVVTPPSMQFVLEQVPVGGNGIVAVPHDPDAVRRCEDVSDKFPCIRPAFLETTRSAPEIDLIRYYDDDGSTLPRPFLVREAAYPVNVNSPGTDQRGIVVDPTPRLVCKAKAVAQAMANGEQPPGPGSKAFVQCGQLPARIFIASRSPSSIIYGTIGGFAPSGDGSYDPDQLHLLGNFPVVAGAARLYLAPIVDATGHYAIRLFVVCYDSAQVFVFDPDNVLDNQIQGATPEAVLSVGPGPFAMAFDPFCAAHGGSATTLVDSTGMRVTMPPLSCQRDGVFADVATSQAHTGESSFLVPADPNANLAYGLRSYRFGYLATFTDSYLQVIDLDNSLTLPPLIGGPRTQETFEAIVFTLGKATPPKGT
jgi:hypothetical protein